jgi:hypothetical protein
LLTAAHRTPTRATGSITLSGRNINIPISPSWSWTLPCLHYLRMALIRFGWHPNGKGSLQMFLWSVLQRSFRSPGCVWQPAPRSLQGPRWLKTLAPISPP